MARGFQTVLTKLDSLATDDIGNILKTTGMALVSTVGGASGPLYGTAFMKAGALMAGKTDMSVDDFLLSGCSGRGREDARQIHAGRKNHAGRHDPCP